MDHERVDHYWDSNTEAWTALARAGYDAYRDGLNTPPFSRCRDGAGLRLGADDSPHTLY